MERTETQLCEIFQERSLRKEQKFEEKNMFGILDL